MTEALIVAHGSPADPAPQEAAVAALARAVAARLPGWRIEGATLAAPGALEAAMAGLAAPAVLPFFMAEGWFTRSALPRRLEAAGRAGLRRLPAFGALPGVQALASGAARAGAAAAGIAPARASLILAAHGSRGSRASAEATRAMAAALSAAGPFARVLPAFLEEAPFLADVARAAPGPALCLPLFALRAGHVAADIPAALAAAGFGGPLLAPLGEHPGVPALLAAALAAA